MPKHRRKKPAKKRGPTPPKERAAPAAERPVAPGYLAVPAITEAHAQAFYEAAAILHAAKLHGLLIEPHPIRLTPSVEDVGEPCLHILSEGGFAIYPSLNDFDSFRDALTFKHVPESDPDEPQDAVPLRLTLTFHQRAKLPDNLRHELEAHDWPLAAPTAHPWIRFESLVPGATGNKLTQIVPEPIDERDFLLATLVARNLPTFVAAHEPLFARGEGPLAEGTFGNPEVIAITFAAPLYESLAKTLDAAPADDRELTPEMQAFTRKIKEGYYPTFPDEIHVALGMETPREAVQSPVGRRQVEALLAHFEAKERRAAPAARVDITPLREELGLTKS
jgi:hypothetical protein